MEESEEELESAEEELPEEEPPRHFEEPVLAEVVPVPPVPPEAPTVVPEPRRSLRANRGQHSNPHRLPKSAIQPVIQVVYIPDLNGDGFGLR